jgi:hypothetical protein
MVFLDSDRLDLISSQGQGRFQKIVAAALDEAPGEVKCIPYAVGHREGHAVMQVQLFSEQSVQHSCTSQCLLKMGSPFHFCANNLSLLVTSTKYPYVAVTPGSSATWSTTSRRTRSCFSAGYPASQPNADGIFEIESTGTPTLSNRQWTPGRNACM